MEIPNTQANAAYAKSIKERIDAETAKIQRANMLAAAKAGLWRGAEVGVKIVALGAAAGLAFVGYSFISGNRASLDQLTAAFRKALQTTTLHADGTVGIQENATVALASGGHVALDPGSVSLAPGGMVSMRPGTVSLAAGDMQSIFRQIQQNVPDKTGKSDSEFDEVTAFQSKDFKDGAVITGWKYHADNNFAAPYYQYCYYREADSTTNLMTDFQFAVNGKLNNDPKNPFNLDMSEAFKLCAWHS